MESRVRAQSSDNSCWSCEPGWAPKRQDCSARRQPAAHRGALSEKKVRLAGVSTDEDNNWTPWSANKLDLLHNRTPSSRSPALVLTGPPWCVAAAQPQARTNRSTEEDFSHEVHPSWSFRPVCFSSVPGHDELRPPD